MQKVILFLLIAIFLVGCTHSRVISTASITVVPLKVPTSTVTSTATIQPSPTYSPTPSPSATNSPSGTVTIWAPVKIQDLLKSPSITKSFSTIFPNVSIEWVGKDPQQIERDLVGSSNSADIIYLQGDQVGDVAAQKLVLIPAFPFHVEPILIFYRRDVFEKAGLSSNPDSVENLVSSWDGLLSTCKAIKLKTGNPCFDLNRQSNSGWLYEAMLQTHGVGQFDLTGNQIIDKEIAATVLEDLAAFWQLKIVGDEIEWTPGWLEHLSSLDKPVAMVIGSSALGKALETWIAPDLVGKWGVVPMPSYVSGLGAIGSEGYLAVSSTAKDPRLAGAVIDFFQRNRFVKDGFITDGNFLPVEMDKTDLQSQDPYFGEQIPSQIYLQALQRGLATNKVLFGPGYRDLHNLLVKAIRLVASGRVSPETAIQQVLN